MTNAKKKRPRTLRGRLGVRGVRTFRMRRRRARRSSGPCPTPGSRPRRSKVLRRSGSVARVNSICSEYCQRTETSWSQVPPFRPAGRTSRGFRTSIPEQILGVQPGREERDGPGVVRPLDRRVERPLRQVEFALFRVRGRRIGHDFEIAAVFSQCRRHSSSCGRRTRRSWPKLRQLELVAHVEVGHPKAWSFAKFTCVCSR